MSKTKITVETTVQASPQQVWECWTKPEHIVHWNHASDDWHCPAAVNDLRPGGRFSYTMASRDDRMRFDFEGEYRSIRPGESIAYTIADGREVTVGFFADGAATRVVETFEAEHIHAPELQREGWQAILDNFRRYAEDHLRET